MSPPDIRARQSRRLAAPARAADDPGDRSGALRRRGAWPSWSPRQWRWPRTPPRRSGRLRGAAADRRHRRRCPGRQSGGDARGLRRGRACRAAARPTSSASPACRWSRAPRSAHFDAATGRYTLYAGGGAIVRPKKEVAIILGIEPEQVRVIAKEVGGNFGTRNFLYPEFVLVVWAREEDRPAGEMDLRSRRGVPQRLCRPRLQVESELALIGRRQLPRPACDQHQQSRRLYRVVHAADQGHAAHDQPLPHAGDGAGARRAEQHAVDRALSQRRPARDHVRDRAADRHGGARASASTGSSCAAATSSRRRRTATPSASPTTAATMPARSTRC